MASRIVSIPVDCTDAELLANFWAAVLGWQIAGRGWQKTEHGRDGVSIAPIGGGPFEIDFRWVPGGPNQSKNRLHLDINPTDRDQDSALNRLLALGATPADVGQGQVGWQVPCRSRRQRVLPLPRPGRSLIHPADATSPGNGSALVCVKVMNTTPPDGSHPIGGKSLCQKATTEAGATNGIESVKKNAPTATVDDQTS